MAAGPNSSQVVYVSGPIQQGLITTGAGSNGASCSVAGCTIPSDSGSNPHANAFTVTTSNNFSTAGVAAGDLVEGNNIKPHTYVTAVNSATQITLSRLPTTSSNSNVTGATLIFHTAGVGAGSNNAKMGGFGLIAGSNITVTPSTSTSGRPLFTLASTASGSGDVSAGSNFGTDNVMIKSDGTSKGVQATGITIADSSNNMSGVGTISSGAITSSGIIKTDDTTDATSTTDGSLQTDGGLSVAKDAVIGDDLKLLSDSAVLSFGADSDTTLTHTDGTGLTLNSTNKLTFGDAASFIHQSSDGVLTIEGEATIDMNATTEVNIDTPSFVVTSSTSDKPDMVIKSTNDDATGPSLALTLDTANSAADDDVAGTISFNADDAGNNQTEYGRIQVKANAVAAGSESGLMSFGVATTTSGAYADVMTIEGGATAAASTVLVKGNLQVDGTTTTVNSTTVTIDDLTFNFAADVTASSALDGAGIILGAANYASGSSFSNNPTLLYDHTGTRWEFSAHDVELKSTTASSSTTTGALIVGGGAGIAADLYVGDDLRLRSDSSVFAMGANADDFSITHDGTTGATIAGNPITITAGGASTWSTSSGALTITSAAACTWSAAAGNLTLDSAAGTATLDGHTGVQIQSSNSGNIDLDSAAEIVLDAATDGTVKLQDAGNTYAEFAHGSVAIANIEDSAGATVVDTWDASEYTAVKYLLVVEDVTNSNKRMSVEMMVMGDDEPTNSAAYYTTYAVLYDDSEFGSFAAAGRTSSNLIDLKYTPVATGGTVNHKVRVVAQRVASI